MNYSIVKMEYLRLIRNRGYLYFLMVLCFIVFKSAPSPKDNYSILLVSGTTGIHNTYWLTTIPMVISNMLFIVLSFFFFRGSLINDREEGLLKEIYITGTSTKQYLLNRFMALFATQLLCSLTMGIAIIMLNIFKSQMHLFDWWYYFKLVLYIQIPTYIVFTAVFLFFEMQSLFRTKLGEIFYFLFAMVMIVMTLGNGLFDLTGVPDVLSSIRSQFHLEGDSVSVFTNSKGVKALLYLGLNITPSMWIRRIVICIVALGSYFIIVPKYCKKDFFTDDYLVEEGSILQEAIEHEASLKYIDKSTYKETISDGSIKIKKKEISKPILDFVRHFINTSNFPRIIVHEFGILWRQHSKSLFFYVLLIVTGFLFAFESFPLMIVQFGFVLLLPALNTIVTKLSNFKIQEAIVTTTIGRYYKCIQVCLAGSLILPYIILILILNTQLNIYEKVVTGGLAIIVLSMGVAFSIQFISRIFDFIFLLIWYVGIVNCFTGIDFFILNKETDIYLQWILICKYISVIVICFIVQWLHLKIKRKIKIRTYRMGINNATDKNAVPTDQSAKRAVRP